MPQRHIQHTTFGDKERAGWRLLFFLFFATTCRGSVVWSLSPERERERQRPPPTIQYVGLPLASMFCFCSTSAAPMSRRGAFPLYPLESEAMELFGTRCDGGRPSERSAGLGDWHTHATDGHTTTRDFSLELWTPGGGGERERERRRRIAGAPLGRTPGGLGLTFLNLSPPA